MDQGIEGADVVMMLRLQRERMTGAYVPSTREYLTFYGLTRERLERAGTDALVMHPGPMNRGVEIESHVADDIHRSAITEQVEMGVAVRMARSEERRVGKEGVSTCRSRGSPDPYKKKTILPITTYS